MGVFGFLKGQPNKRCGTTEYLNILKHQHPELDGTIQSIENRLQSDSGENMLLKNRSETVIKIPVVVHVIYNLTEQNISDARVMSQIDVLNEDYRKLNTNAAQIPSAFSSLAADCEIEFCLASRDPQGNSTTGITHTQTNATAFGLSDAVKRSVTGGVDAWPTDKYLNIWVCNLSNNLLGFATLPGTVLPALDGVVICYKYFGRNTPEGGNYNKGRTATHEVGHWLNLVHIWGDDDNSADPCSGTDQVNDTPNQEGPNFQCPSYPAPSCSNTSDMFMNYMDYTYDQCMNMFTMGQKTRMRNTIIQLRSGLLTSAGCLALPTAEDCDTLNNITGGDGLVYYSLQEVIPTGSGYLTGNNSLNHIAFADSFNCAETKVINGIRFDFAKAIVYNQGTLITAAVWAQNQSGNGPGSPIAQTTFLLSEVANNVANFSFTDVYFPQPPTVSGPYYAGFLLSTGTGDTLSIYSNQFDPTNNNTGWYMKGDGLWKAFSDPELYGEGLSLAIKPVQCIPLSAQTPKKKTELKVMPNPSNGDFVLLEHSLNGNVEWNIIGLDGKVFRTGGDTSNTSIQINTGDLIPGLYFICVFNGHERVYAPLIQTNF
jgi:hypothetical protein